MNEITKPADSAGLVQHAVPSTARAFLGCGEIIAQPFFKPVARRDIMAAVNTCRRELGVSPGTLVTLDALLSCLPCPPGQNGIVSHRMLLTVYASNDTLCFRAKGIADRQLRRHIDALEKAGLLLRRDSANGKRFPLMRDGQVIGAFGLDLTPLFLRSSGILQAAESRRQQDQELRGLRARLRHLCARIAQLCPVQGLSEKLQDITRLARRVSLTLPEANAAIRQLSEMLDNAPPPQQVTVNADAVDCAEMSAAAGHSVRLINPESKTIKNHSQTSAVSTPEWSAFPEISTLFPPPVTETEAQRTASLFGQMLGLQQPVLSQAACGLPILILLGILDRMAQKINEIPSPTGYFLQAVRTARAGTLRVAGALTCAKGSGQLTADVMP